MKDRLEVSSPDRPEIDKAISMVEPFGSQILVVKDEIPGQIGNIVLPEKNELRPYSGVIRKLGAEASQMYREGQRVLFSQYAGNEIKLCGEPLLLLSTMEVLATIDEEARDAAS